MVYYMNIRQDSIHPMEFQKLLGKIEGTPEETMISRLVLCSMKQAVIQQRISAILALRFSITATLRHRSKISDLQIHRIIKENLHGPVG